VLIAASERKIHRELIENHPIGGCITASSLGQRKRDREVARVRRDWRRLCIGDVVP